MSKTLFLGDEAVAQAALDAGLSGVYAYPGTPSTEITEFIQNSKQGRAGEVHSIWAGNEKTAMESAIGMSYAGKRSMVCMKHVGLNVAADPFMNASITGANGGMVVVVADDPIHALLTGRAGLTLLCQIRADSVLRALQPARGLRHHICRFRLF